MACVTGTWAFELVIGVNKQALGSVRVLKNLENMLMVLGLGRVKDNNRPHFDGCFSS